MRDLLTILAGAATTDRDTLAALAGCVVPNDVVAAGRINYSARKGKGNSTCLDADGFDRVGFVTAARAFLLAQVAFATRAALRSLDTADIGTFSTGVQANEACQRDCEETYVVVDLCLAHLFSSLLCWVMRGFRFCWAMRRFNRGPLRLQQVGHLLHDVSATVTRQTAWQRTVCEAPHRRDHPHE
jgi:hypothetical protein